MHQGGGNCLKYLKKKSSGTEQRQGDTKILKSGGQAGSRDGCLKKGGGAGTPLQTMAISDEETFGCM